MVPRGSNFSTPLPNPVIFHLGVFWLLFLYTYRSSMCEVVSHCGFDLNFLMTNDVDHLFMSLLNCMCIFFWKNVCSDPLPSFKLGWALLVYICNIYITWALLLLSMWDLPRSGSNPRLLHRQDFSTEPPGKPSLACLWVCLELKF